MYGTYAYHKPLSPGTTLSAGFQLGFSSINLDRSKIVFSDQADDLAVGFDNGELKKLVPEIGAGLWLYSSSYFIGVSVLNIVPSRVSFVKSGNYGSYLTPHYFASAGYRFWMNDDISILPSVTLQSINPVPVQVHTNVKMQYKDLAWIGGSYRFADELGGFAAMAGFSVNNIFNVSYAYDVSLNSRLRTYTRNTHELIIGFLLNNRYGDLCPKKMW
jgi:type IX secretion system PorP/SprF family membrane protein